MARAHLSTKLEPNNEALICESAAIVTFIGDNVYSLVFAGDLPTSNEFSAEELARERLAQARNFIDEILNPPKQD